MKNETHSKISDPTFKKIQYISITKRKKKKERCFKDVLKEMFLVIIYELAMIIRQNKLM